jgi:tripartite-type tricarboxylate transporter receptor subunit TctC
MAGIAFAQRTGINWVYVPTKGGRMAPQLVAKLNAEIVRILKLPDVAEILVSQGTTPIANTSEQTHRWFVEEKGRWTKVVKDSGFKLD